MAGSGIKVPDLLSIGIATGGMSPANHLVEEALAGFMRFVIRERAAYPNEGLRINTIFHVPGPISQPDYEGVHATRLNRKNQHLLIVAAVPSSVCFDKVSNYCAETLSEARRVATEYLVRRKVSVATDMVNALIDHLLAKIEADASRS